MKRITLTFLAIVLTTAFAMAQAQVGLKVGYNLANIYEGDAYGGGFGLDDNQTVDGDEYWRGGLIIGLAANFVATESFSVLTELDWSQRGETFTDEVADVDNGIRVNYLSLPVLGKFSFGGPAVKGYITVGPTFSYLTGGNVEINDQDFDIEFVESAADFDPDLAADIQVNDEFVNRFEFGGAIGGGVQFNTLAGDFLIDLRYTQGFTDLIDDDEGVFNIRPVDADNYYNQVFSLSLIYLVPSIMK